MQKKSIAKELLREIPSVSSFLQLSAGKELAERFGTGMTKFVLRRIFTELRRDIIASRIDKVPSSDKLAGQIEIELLRLISPEGRRAVNATGILLHTALGRAPYADNARDALKVFNGYSVLQAGLGDGKRTKRDGVVEEMLCELTGAEAATVINNNAEGTMLILNTLGKGKEAVVSRGQLVEIGGSFRMPDVMEQSGALMHEIGTTNRTHLRDYSAAVNKNTGVIVHVHTSNYRIRGFSGTPDIKEICELRRKEFPDIPVVDDIGSGALVKLSAYGVQDEPLVKDSVRAGVDVVCFSGDKLICGPQCGIICGKRDIIEKIRKNPFARMFRVDKMVLAVLESTLIHFINNTYCENIPFYRMLSEHIDLLENRAETLMSALSGIKGVNVEITDGVARVGSGSIPDENIPDKLLCVKVSDSGVTANEIAGRFRKHIPSIFTRINDDSLIFSMRTLLPGDMEVLMEALPELLGK